MKVTQKQVKELAKALGMRATYSPEWGEWRICHLNATPDQGYYTPDNDDALVMVEYMAKEGAK